MADKYALQANFNRYTPETADALARIAAARARIDASEIRPAVADELRVSALAETVHYSTLIEGNELPIIEAERAARGALDPDTKAKIELINYVDALHYLDELAERGAIEITPETILELHKRTTEGLGSEESAHFKPRHEGAWRDGIARVVDRATGRVMHEGPPPEEIPDRMAGLCAWVVEREDRLVTFPPPVIAGVAHYALTDIHPFADGNGRIARLLSAAILMRLGFIARRLFSFERYYAENRDAYYAALRSVRTETFNM
ncbi:MAG TPA: Fic family protein, partial [Candidatus Krumholzibacteria bacterium]